MLKHTFFFTKQNSTRKLFHYILIVTIAFFADAILAFWLPTYLQNTFSSATIMGGIIACSSVVGIITDFLFPQLFPDIHEKKALNFTLFFMTIFIGLLMLSLQFPYWWIFILAVSAWGIYYEFLGFANRIYVTDHVSKKLYTNVWAEIDFGKSFAYLIGPIMAGILLTGGNFSVLIAALLIMLAAQLLLSFFVDKKEEKKEKSIKTEIRPALEIKYWLTLSKKIWPIISLSFLVTAIDATFWTSGAVFSEKIIHDYPMAILIMPLYMAPMLIAQIILIKKEINVGKEKKTAMLLMGSGILLFLMGSVDVGYKLLLTTFGIGFLSAFSFPLIESLYSDLENRMGVHKKHLMGLSSSIFSLAYVIAPITAGFVSDRFGEQKTFSYLGVIVGITALMILIFNRKKIIIPQKEVSTWTEA
jgi:MFS family permease